MTQQDLNRTHSLYLIILLNKQHNKLKELEKTEKILISTAEDKNNEHKNSYARFDLVAELALKELETLRKKAKARRLRVPKIYVEGPSRYIH